MNLCLKTQIQKQEREEERKKKKKSQSQPAGEGNGEGGEPGSDHTPNKKKKQSDLVRRLTMKTQVGKHQLSKLKSVASFLIEQNRKSRDEGLEVFSFRSSSETFQDDNNKKILGLKPKN